MASEGDARINIDQLLRLAGWDPADKKQVATEGQASRVGVGLSEVDTTKQLPERLRNLPD